MKPLIQTIKNTLETALEEKVIGKSPIEREAYLDKVATKLLIDEEREVAVLACKYLKINYN